MTQLLNLPQHRDPRESHTASAPYNFVPLPELVATAVSQPNHDQATGLSGYFKVKLTTKSPLYIRGLLTEVEFQHQEKKQDLAGNEVDDNTPFRQQVKNKPDFFHYGNEQRPVLPGSSLRGMLRTFYEIVTYSKVTPVSDVLKIFFRAVAAPKDDPLRDPYRDLVGPFARNVRAGYLKKDGDQWKICPARMPKTLGVPEKGAFLKVKGHKIKGAAIPGYIYFNDNENYRPQIHEVSFDVDTFRGKHGRYTAVTNIGSRSAGYKHQGTIICSGNMLETAKPGQRSPRKNHALILPPDPRAPELTIRPQAVEDYLNGLTPFQKKKPFDETMGALQEGRPIFYTFDERKETEVSYFGHTPNFRIPARPPGQNRATTPRDFVPEALRTEETLDMAESVFGFVRSNEFRARKKVKQGDKRAGYSSRVYVTDARLQGQPDQIYFIEEGDHTLVPKILASPKPTAFQHYLVQESDNKRDLRHYGSPTPGQTVIRGHKLYWHQGNVQQDDLMPGEDDPDMKDGRPQENSKQYTQIKPLKPGLTFSFRLYFDNLDPVELGALAWVLDLPNGHCHKLGMGKPLGMGAVRLHDIRLHIHGWQKRYETLFTNGCWAEPVATNAKAVSDYKVDFENHMASLLDEKQFASTNRMRMLLEMLRWHDVAQAQLPSGDIKQYLDLNEFNHRKILPTPLAAAKTDQRQSRPDPARQAQMPQQKTAKPVTLHANKELRPGMKLRGTVSRVAGDHIIIDIGIGEEATLHKNRFSEAVLQKMQEKHLRDLYQPGDEIEVWFVERNKKGRVQLTMERP